ncbi:MAG: cytochrome c [Oceanospirillales bacterium]|nr:cytochrome c [Oceanospirillales bacterium]
MKKAWILGVLLGLAVPGWVMAASGDDAIEYRQGLFRALKWNFTDMGAMIQERKPFDAARFAQEADRLAALAPMLGEGFIKGSEKSETVPTRAASELWYQRDRFDQLMQQLEEKTAALAEAAKHEDRDGLRPYFGQVAQACKACHDRYRERD